MRIAWNEYGLFPKREEALEKGLRRMEFVLPRGALRVRVVDMQGRPIAGARVRAHPRDAARYRHRYPGYEFKPGWAAFTNRKGEALLIGLPADAPHAITMRAVGYEPAEKLRAIASPAAPLVAVTLKPQER